MSDNIGIPVDREILSDKLIDLRCVLYLKDEASKTSDGYIKLNVSQIARNLEGKETSTLRTKIIRTKDKMIALGFYEEEDGMLRVKRTKGFFAPIKKEEVENFYRGLSNYELRIYAYLKDQYRYWNENMDRHPGEVYCFTKKQLQIHALGMSATNESKFLEPALDSLVLKGLIKYGIMIKQSKDDRIPYPVRVLLAVNERMTVLDQIQEKKQEIFKNFNVKDDFSAEQEMGGGIKINDKDQQLFILGIDEQDIQSKNIANYLLESEKPGLYPFADDRFKKVDYSPIELAYPKFKDDKEKLKVKLQELLDINYNGNLSYVEFERDRLKNG